MTDRKIYFKAYYQKNKNKIKSQCLSYYYNHHEDQRRCQSKYQDENREQVRFLNRTNETEKRTKEALQFIKRKQIERKYKARRKELREKRKAEGYYRTPERRAANKRWRDNNPEKVKLYERRKYLKRKAKKLNAA